MAVGIGRLRGSGVPIQRAAGAPPFSRSLRKRVGTLIPLARTRTGRSQNPHPVAQIATRMAHPFTTMYRGLAAEIFRVALGEGVPFLRQIIESKNGRNRAHRNTSTAIDAFDGIYVEQLLGGVGGPVF